MFDRFMDLYVVSFIACMFGWVSMMQLAATGGWDMPPLFWTEWGLVIGSAILAAPVALVACLGRWGYQSLVRPRF